MARGALIQYRRGTAAQWAEVNPVLASGEVGFDRTNNAIRIGDGVLPWSALDPIGGVSEGAIEAAVDAYLAEHPVPGATDGDLAAFVLDEDSATRAAVISLALQGPEGDSAYLVAVDNGFIGSEAAWLASLVGTAGATTIAGIAGLQATLDEKATAAELATLAAEAQAAAAAAQSAADTKLSADSFDARVAGEVQDALTPSPLGLMWAGLATRNASPVPIVFAGSSTIAGTGASAPDRSFMAVFTATLQGAYPLRSGVAQPAFKTLAAITLPLAAGIQGVNAGVNGTTSANFLTPTTRTQIGALSPRMVVIQVGANDYQGGVAPGTYRTNVESQIAGLRTAIAAPCLFVLVHQYRRGDTPAPAYAWELYGAALREIAEAAADVVFVNAQPYFDQVGVPTSDPFHLIADTVHPNDAGHAVLADVLTRSLGVPLVIAKDAVAPPVGAMTVVSDAFGRADGPLGNAETGQAWTTVGSNVIAGGKATGTGTATVATDLRDLDVQADLTWNSSALGLVFRSDTNPNRLGVFIGSGAIIFYRTVASANTAVTTLPFSTTVGTTYRMRVVVSGASMAVYIDDVLFNTFTIDATSDSATAGLTRVGWRISGGANEVDNFVVKTLA